MTATLRRSAGLTFAFLVAACGDAAVPVAPSSSGAAAPVLAGRALDEDGKPLAGARISLDPAPRFPRTHDVRTSAETTAGADGAFAFAKLDDGDWTIRCSEGGASRVAVGTLRVPDVPRFDVHLPHGPIYEGTLVDEATTEPVAGARVRAYGGTEVLADVVTDAEGRFTFDLHRVGDGVSRYSVEAPGRCTVPAGEDPGCEVVVHDPGEHVPVALCALKGATVRGVVQGPGGAVADAEVRLWYFVHFGDYEPETHTRQTKTDAKGEYEFTALDGAAFVIRADAPGLVDPRIRDEGSTDVRGWPAEAPDGCRVSLDEDAHELRHDVTLVAKETKRCIVRGRVHDAEDAPVAGVKVRAGLGADFVETTTAANGEFAAESVPFEAGATWASVSPETYAPFCEALEVADDGTTQPLDVELRPASRVSGRVHDSRGDPIPGAHVELVTLESDEELRPEGGGPPFETAAVATMVTGADGAYSLRHRSTDGAVAVVASAPGFGEEHVFVGTSESGEELQNDLVLFAIADLAGRVVRDRTGAPAAGVRVAELVGDDYDDENAAAAAAARAGRVVAVTGADGTFQIRGIKGGQTRLVVSGNGWLPRIVHVELPLVSSIRVELAPSLALRGKLSFEDGGPAKEVEVTAYAEPCDDEGNWGDAAAPTARTRTDGSFDIRGLPPGRYWLSVEGGEPEVVPSSLGPYDADAEIVRELKAPRGASIDGRLVDENGRALLAPDYAIEVRALPSDGEHRPDGFAWVHRSVDGDGGKFHVGGLDAGLYDVVLHPKGWLPVKLERVKPNGAPLVVKLDPGLAIAGHLFASDGTPMAHVALVATPEDPDDESGGKGTTWDTDEEGAFRISGLTPGYWHLDFAGEDRAARGGTQRMPQESEFEAGTRDVRLTCVAVVPEPK